MASGLYRPGMTAAALATKWGLARQTVENLACEASRNIRREIGRSEDIRTRMISTLHTIVAESVRTKKYRDAIEAIRVMTGVVDSDEKSMASAGHQTPTRLVIELRDTSASFTDEVGPVEPKRSDVE